MGPKDYIVIWLLLVLGATTNLAKRRFQPSLLTRLAPLKQINLEDVANHLHLAFYNSELPLSYTSYPIQELEDILENPSFTPNVTTVIYCPGYLEPLNASTTTAVLTSYVKRKYNVIQIDWTSYSSADYFKDSIPSIPAIGQIVAAAIDQIIRAGIPRETVNLVGHSLGAQIVGAIGRNLLEPAPLVVGLDCAGPAFAEDVAHFSKKDGQYTIAIHTDSGFYGTNLNDAHLDVHINGGKRYQPGCPFFTVPFSLSPKDLCSHQRSTNIWADIIEYPDSFLAINCNSFQYLRRKRCDKSKPVIISEKTRGVFGVYYLSTNEASPFSRGLEGI